MYFRDYVRLSHHTEFFSLKTCAYLFALSILVGSLGYFLIEDYTLAESVYMAVITLSTVGYGEVKPLSAGGRVFTSLYVLANLGITALFISQLTQHLRNGGIIAQLRRRLMKQEIDSLHDHVIVCGVGRYGREIVDQLAESEETVLVIERERESLDALLEGHPEALYLEGDATDDDTLITAGVRRAKHLIVTLGDDSDNAFAVLSARQLSPKLNIIARVYQASSRSKLLSVGADHVVQPEQIGSFFMATLVRKPSAVEFFTSLASGSRAAAGFEEVSYASLPAALRNVSLREMDLRRKTGVNVIALRYADKHYEVNPGAEEVLSEGMSFIAIGDGAQLERLRGLLRA